MSPARSLRKSLAYVLIFSLHLTGLISITIRQSYASNNPPPSSSSTQTINDTNEQATPQTSTVDEATRSRVSETLGQLPLSFEENQGQVDKEVKYISRSSGYTLFLTQNEAVMTLRSADEAGQHKKQSEAPLKPQFAIRNPQSVRQQPAVLRMKLSGANPSPAVSGESEMGMRTNYFIGNDPQKWQTGVSRYERVRYAQVYPGVDMIYYGQQRQLEYDFEVAPGADARRIGLEFDGVKRVKVERRTGDLILKTAGGEVRQHKPIAYQEVGGEHREVESRYVMQGERKIGIEVGEYDRTKRLVIDPVLSYSTYLGGNSEDVAGGIAADSAGNAYVAGSTLSKDFPKLHQYSGKHNYNSNTSDAFITKLGADPPAITISGRVKLPSGTGLSGVTITLTDGAGFTPRTTTTAANGTYSFSDVRTPGNYTLTPSKTSYRFNRTQLILNNVTTAQTAKNFVATFQTYTISGVVKLGEAGLKGVKLKLTSPSQPGFSPRTATTSNTGAYSFTDVPADRDYTVTPTVSGFQIAPASKEITHLSADQEEIDFAVPVYTIKGRIRQTSVNTGIGAVTITLTSLAPANFTPRTVRTDSTGNYTFTNLPAGRNYTIKPVKSGFTFNPAKRSITNLSANISAGVKTNFTGTGP